MLRCHSNFDDGLPTEYYRQLARRTNCLNATSVFSCLRNADTLILQNASSATSYSARFNQWAFIPVTDNKLIFSSPTEQLPAGKVNGEAFLAGVSPAPPPSPPLPLPQNNANHSVCTEQLKRGLLLHPPKHHLPIHLSLLCHPQLPFPVPREHLLHSLPLHPLPSPRRHSPLRNRRPQPPFCD